MGSATRTTREGLRVTASTGSRVRVFADLNSERAARELATDAREALAAAGYRVEVTENPAAFYVRENG
jgi:hypothetical protein